MRVPELSRPVNRSAARAAPRPFAGVGPQSIVCVTGSCTSTQCCVDLPVIGKKCIPNPLHVGGVAVKACLEKIFPHPQACFFVNGKKIACLG